MPIKGMSTVPPKPAYLGKLRLGGPKQQRTKGERTYEVYGQDLDHFRLDPTDPNDTAIVEALQAEYGAQPNHITVYLPHQTAEQNFGAWMEEYDASQLVHRCDGETLHAHNHRGELVSTGQPCPYAAGKERTTKVPGCKQVGRLEVFVPALVTHAGRFGIVTVETHSIHNIVNLSQQLAYYEQMTGDLRGRPFVLSRVPREISTPNGDKRTRRTKWLLQLQPSSEWVMRQLQAPDQQRALPAPVVDRETGEILESTARLAPPRALRATLEEFHRMGQALFGDGWPKQGPRLIQRATDGQGTKSTDLTEEQAQRVIAGMRQELAKRQAASTEPAEVLAERFSEPDAVADDASGSQGADDAPPALISAWQREQIAKLLREVDGPNATIEAAVMAEYGLPVAELTHDQAQSLLNALAGELRQMQQAA